MLSGLAMAEGRKPNPAANIPDLDLGPARPSGKPGPRAGTNPVSGARPAPSPNPVGPPASGTRGAKAPGDAQEYFGAATFDEDSLGAGAAGIALDTGDAVISAGDAGQYFGGGSMISSDLDDDLDLLESTKESARRAAASAPPAERKNWPSGRSPDATALSIDKAEVRTIAGYGPAPETAVLTPMYSARVFVQKKKLSAVVRDLASRLGDAERRRDERVVAMVQDLRGKICTTEDGERLFEPILELEKAALERRSALAGASAEHGARAEDHDAELLSLKSDVSTAAEKAEGRRAALAEAERAFERAEAKKKRFYIEIRSILDVAERSGTPPTKEQEATLSRLEANVAAQKPELDAATAARDAARDALSQAEREQRDAERRVTDTERRWKAEERESRRRLGAQSAEVTEAEERRFEALATAGRAVLAGRGRIVDVAKDVLDAIAREDASVVERATELEKHVRAVDAYDPEAFRKGFVVAGGALAALVALLLFAALR